MVQLLQDNTINNQIIELQEISKRLFYEVCFC